MGKIAVVSDSNSGITQSEAEELGIHIVPMPFMIEGKTHFEEVDLDQETFYQLLHDGVDVLTSMPAVGDVTDLWEKLLASHDEVVYIPMSSGLSSSCQTAIMLAQEYDGRVQVVDNHRISVTQRQSVLDAMKLAEEGKTAVEIKEKLEAVKDHSSIYIMVDTMHYLKKGGRVTATAAALGTLLKIKPVLQINGEKLDLFAKARTTKQAKAIMIEAMKRDFLQKYQCQDGSKIHLEMSYTFDKEAAENFRQEVQKEFPNNEIVMQPLSLSISCHIGPGALAVACSEQLN